MISPIIENWTCPKAIDSLKCYLRNKLLVNRLQSFEQGNTRLDDKTQLMAVTFGFYYIPELSVISCFSCGLQIPEENLEIDRLDALHRDFSIDCPYKRMKDSSLSSIFWDNKTYAKCYGNPRINIEIDKSTPVFLRVSRLEKIEDGYLLSPTETTVINPEKVYQLFQFRMNRDHSFKDAPITEQMKNRLVENGFFWLRYNRTIQCAFCRLAIEATQPSLPVYAHKELSPNCPFLTKTKYDIERRFCSICLTVPANMLYIPCHHLAVCKACDDVLKTRDMRCPMCRTNVVERIECITP